MDELWERRRYNMLWPGVIGLEGETWSMPECFWRFADKAAEDAFIEWRRAAAAKHYRADKNKPYAMIAQYVCRETGIKDTDARMPLWDLSAARVIDVTEDVIRSLWREANAEWDRRHNK